MSGSTSEFGVPAVLSASEGEQRRHASRTEETVLELFDALRSRLFRYLASFSLSGPDAEEIIQETFLALFQHLERGRSRENLRGWLFRVARNLALKRRQKAQRDTQMMGGSVAAVDLVCDPGLNPEDEFAAREKQFRLMAVVRALPEQDRECLVLRAEGLPYREIAEVLNMSLASVSLSLGRSLARISRAAEW